MIAGAGLVHLMRLVSPSLPVGTFAYSQGLEWAAASGMDSEDKTRAWIFGILEHSLARLDVPVLARLRAAWETGGDAALRHWTAVLFASRETAELRAEELQTAGALARLLRDLGVTRAAPWLTHPRRTYCLLFALAGAHWGIGARELCCGYLWSWAENQILAAIKAVPLGQTAGQRMASLLAARIPELVEAGLGLGDEEIGGAAPGQIMASALHETQRTRLFRS